MEGIESANKSITFDKFGIATLLLLLTTLSPWLAFVHSENEIDRMNDRLVQVSNFSRRHLHVQNPDNYAAVKLPRSWYEEHEWHVFLPKGTNYTLNLSAGQIPKEGVPTYGQSFELEPGTYEFEFERSIVNSDWRMSMRVDATEVLSLLKPLSWYKRTDVLTKGHGLVELFEQPTSEPLILLQHRYLPNEFGIEDEGDMPGICVWVSAISPTTR